MCYKCTKFYLMEYIINSLYFTLYFIFYILVNQDDILLIKKLIKVILNHINYYVLIIKVYFFLMQWCNQPCHLHPTWMIETELECTNDRPHGAELTRTQWASQCKTPAPATNCDWPHDIWSLWGRSYLFRLSDISTTGTVVSHLSLKRSLK